jgi:hypothetical protein
MPLEKPPVRGKVLKKMGEKVIGEPRINVEHGIKLGFLLE